MFWKKKIDQEKLDPHTITTRGGLELLTLESETVEALRHMAARLTLTAPLPDRLVFVSSIRQEGVTYLSRAWGAVIANDFQKKVGVVELNWWWPDQTAAIIEQSKGLAAVLHDEQSIDEVIFPTSNANLDFIPAGNLGLGERPVLARSEHIKKIIDDLSDHYDHLVLDLPALRATSDAIPLASFGNSCCLVIQQGVTPVESVNGALDDIKDLPIMGVILNKVKTRTPGWVLRFIPQDANALSGTL